ncbi:MAG: sugar transferase [Nannocystaceae bacterium]|nr:sugar transferase [Nannocystaceae bacterium]
MPAAGAGSVTRHQAAFFRRLVYLYDLAVSVVAFFAALSLRSWLFDLQTEGTLLFDAVEIQHLDVRDYTRLLWGLLPLWVTAFYFSESSDYRLSYLRAAGRYVRAIGIGIALFVVAIFVFKIAFVARSFVIVFAVVQFVSLVLGRIALLEGVALLRRGHVDGHRVLVVGTGVDAVAFARTVRTQAPFNNHLVGYITIPGEPSLPEATPIVGRLERLDEVLDGQPVDEVVFAPRDLPPDLLEEPLRQCDERGVEVLLTLPPDVPRHGKIEVAKVTGYDLPMIGLRRTPTDEGSLVLKRLLDLAAGLFGLMLIAPILLFTALAIRLESKGPVLFKQARAGRHGRRFTMYKFRSMVIDAEAKKKELMHLNEMDGPVFKIKHDPRITKVGRLIRKTSIDELPQLFNVLFGDMSLVGPRPPLPSEVQQYEPWQRRRLSVKPGITGLWQVSGRNNIDFDEWMELDLTYIDTWSLWLDIKILLKTIPVVLFQKGSS